MIHAILVMRVGVVGLTLTVVRRVFPLPERPPATGGAAIGPQKANMAFPLSRRIAL